MSNFNQKDVGVYNLVGTKEKVAECVSKFKLNVEDRFKPGDLNVFISDEDVDAVSDWCEDNGVACKLV